jgi:DNA mismatch endonuclease (patch repair protein)
MDTLTPSDRSARMALIRATDTKPEMVVRRLVHAMGYRYRLHVKGLPGRPDLVFRRLRKVIFIHGCFWHQHACPAGNRMPKSRIEFWRNKLEGNKARDAATVGQLRRLGWKVLTLWECDLRNLPRVERRIRRFLSAI